MAMCLLLPWCASAQTTMSFTVQQPAPPVAGFSFTLNNLTFQLTDLSTGSLAAWHWDFGNGDSSNVQNPVYTYPDGGTFVICLTVRDIHNCTATHCDTVTFTGVQAPGHLRAVTLQPNPFSGTTSLQYTLDHSAQVRIHVYSVQGALVEQVAEGEQLAGAHTLELGAGLAQGSYMVMIEVDGQAIARKLVKLQ